MEPQAFIARITQDLRHDENFRGLFLGGSFARETADGFSDVDLIALVEPQAQGMAVVRWMQLLETIEPVVFWRQRGTEPLLLNAITQSWLRCDLLLAPPSQFPLLSRRTVAVLIDRDDLLASVPEAQLLPAEDIDLLSELSPPRATAADVVRSHHELARLFLPRAHQLATMRDSPWPIRFERATLTMLSRQGGALGAVDWNSLHTR